MSYDMEMSSSSSTEVSDASDYTEPSDVSDSSEVDETAEIDDDFENCEKTESYYDNPEEVEVDEDYSDCELAEYSDEDYEEYVDSDEEIDDYSDCGIDEAVEEQVEEKEEVLEDAEEEASEEIYESVEGNVEEAENLEEDEIEENVEEDVTESLEDTELSDEEVNEIVEEKSEETDEAVEEQVEEKEEVLEDAEEEASEEIDASVEENVEIEEKTIEAKHYLDEEQIEENVEEDVEESLEDTELSDEEVEEIAEEKSEEAEEAVEEQVEENEEALKEAEDIALEETYDSVEENIEAKEELTEEQIEKNVEEDVAESLEDTELSDEESEELIEENSEEIQDTIEEQKNIKESEEELSETAIELEEQKDEIVEAKEQQDLSDRVNKALENDNLSYSELEAISKENSEKLKALEEEKNNLEAQMGDKFDEVLSKERGSDEYKKSLQEYNELKDQKEILDEQYSAVNKQQEGLKAKSAQLSEAQLQKGREAVAESTTTLAAAKLLEENFDNNYYQTKPDIKAMEKLTEDNSALVKELSSEKDSIKLAMDAKMDQISKYVTSNNLSRYETSNDPYYQKLNAEYLEMKSAYDKVDYSIVKLDENNRLMNEVLLDNGSEIAVRQFGRYQVDNNGFVKGENYAQYIDYWNNYSDRKSRFERFDEPEIVTISPSLVEGIPLYEHDVSNPEDFWSQHEPGGTEQSFNEIASKIPLVKEELANGKPLSDILQDENLGACACIYFKPENMPEVIKCGDHYEFQSNGRHRILAARNQGYDIPVRVVGERNYDVLNNENRVEVESLEKAETENTNISDIKSKFAAFFSKNDSGVESKIEVNNDVVSAQKMIDKYCNSDLENVLSDEKKNVRLSDTVEFQQDEEFAKGLGGKERAEGVNGYNDGKKSYVKSNGPHPKKTAIHEHNHQLSCNDAKDQFGYVTEYRRGISINGRNVQVNEALTELFTKKMMGTDYPTNPNVGYKDNMLRIEKMENGFGIDTLKTAYYQNKPDLLKAKYESVMGAGSWESFSKSFDDSLSKYSKDEVIAKTEHYKKYGTSLKTPTDEKRANAVAYANKCATLFAIKTKRGD